MTVLSVGTHLVRTGGQFVSRWGSWRDGAEWRRRGDLGAMLLTGSAGAYPRQGKGYEHPGITLKGIVGLELKARGFDVDLEIYEAEDYFDVQAGIVVTNPGTDEDVKVHVTDDGGVTWVRDYWAEAATITWEPEYYGWIADPARIASAVVETITQAMSQACPAGQAPSA